MSSRLAGRHLFITGGARGIGRAIVEAFAQEQVVVSIADSHADNLTQTIAELRGMGAESHPHLLDVTDQPAVVAAVEAAERRAPIDILINDAGIAFETGFLDIPAIEWRQVLEVNLTGMFLVSQAVARCMATRQRGVILNMASKNAVAGEAGYAHYNASKGGVLMLTRTMALELAQFGIRVNAVAPGYLQTPMSEAIDSPEFVRDFVDRYIPLGRPGHVHDIAPLFVFLASDDSAFLTGETIIVDGGQLAGQKASIELLRRLCRPR